MRYFVGLGSNIAPHQHVPLMLRALLQIAPALHVGRILQTTPVGVEGAPFLNVPASFDSSLPPPELKALCNTIEASLGRDRTDPASKRKSRTADLDILFWLDDGATTAPAQLLPPEPYIRPILLELLDYVGIATTFAPPALPPGVALTLDGLSLGEAPLTLTHTAGRLVAQRRPATPRDG